MPRDGRQHFALIKCVIAQGHHVGPRIAQDFEVVFGQTPPMAGIFAVDDDEIEAIALDKARKLVCDRFATGPAHDVTKKQ